MPLSGLPLVTKYAYLDYVFILLAGRIESVQIASWRVVVDNPLNDSEGRQRTYYKFTDKGNLELAESKIYSSRNHLLWSIKKEEGLYSALNIASESQTGGYEIFQSIAQGANKPQANFADWVDLAGLDLQNAVFQGDAYPFIGSGLVSIENGSTHLTGVGTSFEGDFLPGYPILINYADGNPLGCIRFVQSIEDDENLTLTSPVNQDYTDVRAFYFQYEQPALAAGTVTITSGTKTVTGVNTLFTQLEVNDNVSFLTDADTVIRRVVETITDNTHMTVKTNVNSNVTAKEWYKWKNLKSDVGFTLAYHGNGSSPEEIQGAKTLVFDGTNLSGATMPSIMNTKAKFRDVVRSYDAESTIWTDGEPIGRP